MSHINNIGGYNAAAEYQEFLERLKSSRQTEKEEHVRGRTVRRDFDTEIEEQRQSDQETGADAEAQSDPDADSGQSRKSYA